MDRFYMESVAAKMVILKDVILKEWFLFLIFIIYEILYDNFWEMISMHFYFAYY